MNSLPPDPWRVLGIDKSADKTEIRAAYRKLVLKCHPDKVQDPTLKAQKQDEFQRVQQAYELLNDDTERAKYEEQVKLSEMRKAAMLSKNMPNISVSRTPPRPSHTFYEVRTAEPPREPRFRHASPHYSSPVPPGAKVYAHVNASAKPYEDDLSPRSHASYEEDRAARRAASYEQPSRRDDEKREERKRREARDRREDEDRERERHEKEKRKQERREREKIRDKEKRRDVRSKGVYVEEYDRDEVYPPATKVEKKKVSLSSSSKKADEPREKSSSRRVRDESPRVPSDKHDFLKLKEESAKEEAAAYIERHRAKAKAVPPLGRSQTFQDPPTYARHVPSPPAATAAVYDDGDVARRSSARTSRRASNDQGARSQEKLYSPSQKKSREDIDVVDTSARAERMAPPRAAERIFPVLKKSNSTPPIPPPVQPESPPRRPLRQNTAQEVHSRPPPPMPSMPRASTFTHGEKPERYPHVIRGVLVESDDEGVYDDRRRHRTSRRTHSPEPMKTRRYRAKDGLVTPVVETVYEPEPYDHYEDRPTARRHASSYREGPEYYYDSPAAAQFPKVKTSKYITPEDVQYSNIYPPSQGNWVAA